ncbi:MAG: response regulator transcription factor [Patescibacteria group bacterium]
MDKKRTKIILVEDDKFLSRMYKTKLEMEGFEVHTAFDGKVGLAMIQKELPDVLLLDIILPELEGWDIIKQMKKDPATKDIPIIVLSNLGSDEDVAKAKLYGVKDYLVKAHFIPREVIAKIKKILNKKES